MGKKTIVKGVELPFFYGFYESPLNEIDDAIDCEIKYSRSELNEELEWDDFDYDWDGYRNAVCQAFIDVWKENYLPDWVENIEFEELWSPRYYNFETDRCYVTVTLTKDWNDKIAHFFNEHHEWLEKRIKEDWSSRSGFISYMENDYEAFYQNLIELEPRYISTVIGYYALINNNELDDMYNLACETMEKFDMNDGVHNYLTRNKKEKQDTNEIGESAANDNI